MRTAVGRRRTSRTRLLLGLLLALLGAVWIAQGLGELPGSFMSGDRTWAAVGTVAVIAGLGLAVAAVRGSTGR